MSEILARDAYHADRLYWQRNPPARRPGELTSFEAAKALGVTVWTVLDCRRRGELGGRRSADRWLFSRKAIEAYLETHPRRLAVLP